ncbi:MAG: hypothetical protein IPK76_21240 [Lewinellaceae bacterium]|nr:hypothetical protein [Lewinellaceae bacterium]
MGGKMYGAAQNVDAIPSGSVTWEVISAFAAGTTIRVVEQSPANLNIVYISRGVRFRSALYRSDTPTPPPMLWFGTP